MTESHDNTTCRRATTTDPTVQAHALLAIDDTLNTILGGGNDE